MRMIACYVWRTICTKRLAPELDAFCYSCKAPTPVDWTTGNTSLDSFIMESWNNMTQKYDAHILIQCIEYSLLTNIRAVTSLHHRCTHIADWQSTRVALKQIVGDAQGLCK